MQISVVIPTYSRPGLLKQALQSIAAQSYRDWEVIVIDDGSNPPVTAQDISPIVGDRFRLLHHHQSLGTAVAKNRGVAAASGDLITLLDDDDLLEPFALQAIADAFAACPRIDCLFMNITPFGRFAARASANQGSALDKVIDNAALHKEHELVFFGPALFSTLLQTTPIPMQRPVARPATWKIIGSFSPGIMCPEPAWSARAALLCRTALLSRPVYRWRVDGQNHASRPEMQSAAINCIIEDRVLLMKTMQNGVLGEHIDRCTLRASVATLLLDQALELLTHGKRRDALQRLGSSLRYTVSWRSVKTAIQLLLPGPAAAPQ